MKTPNTNMNKQWRKEIRELETAFGKVVTAKVKSEKGLTKLDREAIRHCKRVRKAIRRQFDINERKSDRALTKITRRIAILQGRLS